MNRPVCVRYLLLIISLPLILLGAGCNASSVDWPPTPGPDTGTVVGMVVTPLETGFHYSAKDLYLGKLLPADQPDVEPAISFTLGVDPGITIDNSDGTFAFTEVEPGTYVLLIWTPETSFIVDDSDGGLIKVVVEMDKVTDLGNITLP